MTKHTKQISAIAVLSLLIAVESFFLTAGPGPTDSPTPAAYFGKPTYSHSLRGTKKPDGQTEFADCVSNRNLKKELTSLLPELRNPFFTVDWFYISPTEQTARIMLKRAFRKLDNRYVSEAYDCDDNAQELMVLLRKEALVEFREFPAALAIGFVGVRIDGPVDGLNMGTRNPKEYPLHHAMVVMRIKGGKWLLIEPLSHQVCEFTGPIYEGQLVVGLLYF